MGASLAARMIVHDERKNGMALDRRNVRVGLFGGVSYLHMAVPSWQFAIYSLFRWHCHVDSDLAGRSDVAFWASHVGYGH